MSRRRFLEGTAAAALVGIPFLDGKTVAFGQATTGKLSAYCRGDGSNEHAQIQKCFDENLYVEIDDPGDLGRTYGFDPAPGINLRSGHEVTATYSGRPQLVRAAFAQRAFGLRNAQDRATTDVTIRDVWIDGKGKDDPYYLERWNAGTVLTGYGVRFFTNDGAPRCERIRLYGVRVDRWPGVAFRGWNGHDYVIEGCHAQEPARGGIVYTRNMTQVKMLNCTSLLCGDDALALNAVDPQGSGQPNGGEVSNCETSQRPEGPHGAGLALRGAKSVVVLNLRNEGAKNATVAMTQEGKEGKFMPQQITVTDCHSYRADHAVRVVADKISDVTVARMNAVEPNAVAYRLLTKTGKGVRWSNVEIRERLGETSVYIDPKIKSGLTIR